MFVKKIPKRFLIHSVTLLDVEIGEGAFGERTVKEKQTIRNVRVIQPSRKITVSKENEDYTVSAVLLHQAGISTPAVFKVGGFLRWQGQDYEITAVEEQYEAERLHHTEVSLCL